MEQLFPAGLTYQRFGMTRGESNPIKGEKQSSVHGSVSGYDCFPTSPCGLVLERSGAERSEAAVCSPTAGCGRASSRTMSWMKDYIKGAEVWSGLLTHNELDERLH